MTTPVMALMVKPPSEVSPISEYVVAGPFGSSANAVTPTVVPAAEPSMTALAVALLSTGVVIATSVTLMAKFCELVSVPSLATAVMFRMCPGPVLSKSILVGSATETTPVTASILKAPLALLERLNVTPGPLTSLDDAVTPTSVLAAAPSATELAPPLESTGVAGARSATLMVKLCELVPNPSLEATVMV